MEPAAIRFVKNLRTTLSSCPAISKEYFDSFDYTTTSQNYCHPRMLGLIVKAAWSIPGITVVDIDVRVNLGNKIKFQPDVLAINGSSRHWLLTSRVLTPVMLESWKRT